MSAIPTSSTSSRTRRRARRLVAGAEPPRGARLVLGVDAPRRGTRRSPAGTGCRRSARPRAPRDPSAPGRTHTSEAADGSAARLTPASSQAPSSQVAAILRAVARPSRSTRSEREIRDRRPDRLRRRSWSSRCTGPAGSTSDPPVGADGDFVTSPHVHPVVRELLVARRSPAMRDGCSERPRPVRIVEVGAGDGTLARQLLDALRIGRPAYAAVELSAAARAALAASRASTVASASSAPPRRRRARERAARQPAVPAGARRREVRVDVDGDRLVERRVPVPTSVGAVLGGRPSDGELVVPVGALGFIERLAPSSTRRLRAADRLRRRRTGRRPRARLPRPPRRSRTSWRPPGRPTSRRASISAGSPSTPPRLGLQAFGPVTQQRALVRARLRGVAQGRARGSAGAPS